MRQGSGERMKLKTLLANRTRLLLSGILLLAAALRLFHLGSKKLWYDEVVSLAIAQNKFVSGHLFNGVVYKPLYFFLLKLWSGVLGVDAYWLRFPSVLLGIGTVFVVYLLGKEFKDKATGLVAAFLLAMSSFHVYHSQQVRHFTLMVLLVALSFLYCFRMLKAKDIVRNRNLNVVTNMLMVFVHPYMLTIMAAQLVVFGGVVKRVLGGQWIRVQMITMGAVLFWLMIANKKAMFHSTWWISKPSVFSLIETFQTFIYGGERYGLDDYKVIFNMPWVVHILFVFCFIFFLKGILEGIQAKPVSRLFLAVLVWFFMPMTAAFMVSLVYPVYLVKHLMVSLPAFYLLVAAGITSLRSTRGRLISLMAIFVLSVYPLKNVYTQDWNVQWGDAVACLRQEIQENDAVLISSESELSTFLYYFSDDPASVLKDYDVSRYCRTDNGHCLPAFYERGHLVTGIPQYQGVGGNALKVAVRGRLEVLVTSHAHTIWVLASRWARAEQIESYLIASLSQTYKLVKQEQVPGVNIYKFKAVPFFSGKEIHAVKE